MGFRGFVGWYVVLFHAWCPGFRFRASDLEINKVNGVKSARFGSGQVYKKPRAEFWKKKIFFNLRPNPETTTMGYIT